MIACPFMMGFGENDETEFWTMIDILARGEYYPCPVHGTSCEVMRQNLRHFQFFHEHRHPECEKGELPHINGVDLCELAEVVFGDVFQATVYALLAFDIEDMVLQAWLSISQQNS